MRKLFMCFITLLTFCSMLTSCKQYPPSEYVRNVETVQSSTRNSSSITGEKSYIGILGNNLIINMNLIYKDGKINGTCYYYTSQDSVYPITGEINNSNIQLYQLNSNGDKTCSFEGLIEDDLSITGKCFAADNPEALDFKICEKITDANIVSLNGSWTRIDNTDTHISDNSSYLDINKIDENFANFNATAYSGTQSSNLSGIIEIKNGLGVYKNDDESFKLHLLVMNDTLMIITCGEKLKYGAPEIVFDGKYKKSAP